MSRYSTIAFEGVAALIEHAGGAPWEQAVAAVGERVGATGFTFDADGEPARGRRRGRAGARLRPRSPRCGIREPGSSAGRRTCSPSAARCCATTGRSSSPVGAEAMLRPLTAGLPKLEPYPESRGQDWGFTWNLRHSAPGLLARDTFGHGGWAGSEFWITPSRGVCFVLLTNIGGGIGRFGVDADELHNAVVAAAAELTVRSSRVREYPENRPNVCERRGSGPARNVRSAVPLSTRRRRPTKMRAWTR